MYQRVPPQERKRILLLCSILRPKPRSVNVDNVAQSSYDHVTLVLHKPDGR